MKKYKLYDVITVIGLLVILYGFALTTLILPDTEFSEDENRILQQKPEFTVESLVSGKFTSEIADYFSDQIPLRNIFVGIKSSIEIAMQKNENDDVLLGKNGTIIAKNDHPDYTTAGKNVKAINRFSTAVSETSPVTVAIAGRSQDVLTKDIPSLYPSDELTAEIFGKVCGAIENTPLDLLNPLSEHAANGEYVYYRTDHHWTTLGAYYAYCEIMKAWGIEPYPLSHFTVETASEEFYGTTWSKAGMKWIKPDTIEYFRYDGDEDLICEIVGTDKKTDGLYDRSYLSVKDKYSSFIGGNNAHVTITGSKKRETVLLIKDSFGHALAPFLAAHFDLDILDLRYYTSSAYEYAIETAPSKILILYNMDSIVNSNSLAMLNLGIR